MKNDYRMLNHNDIGFRTLFMPWRVSSRYRLPSRRKTTVFRQVAFGQKQPFCKPNFEKLRLRTKVNPQST